MNEIESIIQNSIRTENGQIDFRYCPICQSHAINKTLNFVKYDEQVNVSEKQKISEKQAKKYFQYKSLLILCCNCLAFLSLSLFLKKKFSDYFKSETVLKVSYYHNEIFQGYKYYINSREDLIRYMVDYHCHKGTFYKVFRGNHYAKERINRFVVLQLI